MASVCWCTMLLTRVKRRTSAGAGVIAHKVNQGSIATMAASAPVNAKRVPTKLTNPNPTSDLTADTSLEARDIRSPVRWAA